MDLLLMNKQNIEQLIAKNLSGYILTKAWELVRFDHGGYYYYIVMPTMYVTVLWLHVHYIEPSQHYPS